MSTYCYFNLGLTADAANAYLLAMMKVRDAKGKSLFSKWGALQEVKNAAAAVRKAGKNPATAVAEIKAAVKAKNPTLTDGEIDAAIKSMIGYGTPKLESLMAPAEVLKNASKAFSLQENPLNNMKSDLQSKVGYALGKERGKQHQVLNVLAHLPADLVQSHFGEKLKGHRSADIFLVSLVEVDKKGQPVMTEEKDPLTGKATPKPVTTLATLHYSGSDTQGLTQATMLDDDILGGTLEQLARDVAEKLKGRKADFQSALNQVCQQLKDVSKAADVRTTPNLAVKAAGEKAFVLDITGVYSVKDGHPAG